MGAEDSSFSPVRLRFPTLELYSALHGDSLSLGGRPLGPNERKEAESIFESSINLDRVRIVRAVVANAPTTLGNYIRIPMNGVISYPTLIHELTHIWQYQTMGTKYISDSMCHQVAAHFSSGSRDGAYVITDENLRARSLVTLPAEKQAMIVEQYYSYPSLRTDANYCRFIEQVRRARPLPESLVMEEAAFGPGADQRKRLDDPTRNSDGTPGVVSIFRLEF